MRIALLTAHDENYREVACQSVPNKAAYCAIRGYTMIAAGPSLCDPSRPASWSKISILQAILQHFDWVFWSDADALIANASVKLESFMDSADLVISREDPGVGAGVVNAGHFLLQNSPWAKEFLLQVWNDTQCVHHPWWEQQAILKLLKTEAISSHVKVVPQRSFNSYPDNYQKGDFIIHLSGTRDAAKLSLSMKAWNAQIRTGCPNAEQLALQRMNSKRRQT